MLSSVALKPKRGFGFNSSWCSFCLVPIFIVVDTLVAITVDAAVVA